jgi:glycosyltransferase involved in cell wall biosynthesis
VSGRLDRPDSRLKISDPRVEAQASQAQAPTPLLATRGPLEAAHPPLATPDPRLRAVVVVPARDEVERIGACLRALADQRGVDHAAYEAVVVLDGCLDATRERVLEVGASRAHLRLHVVELGAPGGVGRARRLGMDLACERLLAVARPQGLIASTDADSVVAEDWLAAQLALAREGAKAIGGRIELDDREARELSREALERRGVEAARRLRGVLESGVARGESIAEHHQFSGASLALTVTAYRECGGLPVSAALEDEALERELSNRGIPIHRSRSVRVRTSARTEGRAPRGLAHDLTVTDWRARRSFQAEQFPLERLLAAKRESIAVVLPAREVATSIGAIARCVADLQAGGLIDEALVIDSASVDGTAAIAVAAGLTVIQEDTVAPGYGPAQGKGDAMWRALQVVRSDIVVYLDADTESFHAGFLMGLLGPLICEPEIQFVKGCFERPFRAGSGSGLVSRAGEGGRVTELLARPLLNLHAPELAVFDQPLAGEVAARRELLVRLPFSVGYGVEIAMLIDAWRAVGLDGLAQVHLGTRQNAHQSLRALSAMAYAVLVAASTRFLGSQFADANASGSIVLPPQELGAPMEMRRVPIEERPPLLDLGR